MKEREELFKKLLDHYKEKNKDILHDGSYCHDEATYHATRPLEFVWEE